MYDYVFIMTGSSYVIWFH